MGCRPWGRTESDTTERRSSSSRGSERAGNRGEGGVTVTQRRDVAGGGVIKHSQCCFRGQVKMRTEVCSYMWKQNGHLKTAISVEC